MEIGGRCVGSTELVGRRWLVELAGAVEELVGQR